MQKRTASQLSPEGTSWELQEELQRFVQSNQEQRRFKVTECSVTVGNLEFYQPKPEDIRKMCAERQWAKN